MPEATCEGSLWYKEDDMGAGFCTPNYEKVGLLLGVRACDSTRERSRESERQNSAKNNEETSIVQNYPSS